MLPPDEGDVRRGLPRGLIVIALLIVATAGIGLLVLGSGVLDNSGGLGLTITATLEDPAPTRNAEALSTDAMQPPTVTRTVASTDTPTAEAAARDAPTALPLITETAVPSATFTASPTATETLTLTPSITPTHTATATATPTATPTLPPQGLQGEQNLIALLPRLAAEEMLWDAEQFGLSAEASYWRLGVGGQTPGDEIRIRLSAAVLDRYYGADAASRLRRVEARVSLLTADPLLPPEDVYFGLMLVPADGAGEVGMQAVGAQVQIATLQAINLYQRLDADETFISQQSVNQVLGRLRVDRDLSTGVVITYFNGVQIGQTLTLSDPDAPLVPVLYIRDGGVVASVTDWTVTLR